MKHSKLLTIFIMLQFVVILLNPIITMGGEESIEVPQIQNIGSRNELATSSPGILINQSRSFTWLKVKYAETYRLVVANDTSFASPFIYLSNISSDSSLNDMPGGSYTEDNYNVYFDLPYAYNVTYEGTHYYKVLAYAPYEKIDKESD